jgi:hypothetical protein
MACGSGWKPSSRLRKPLHPMQWLHCNRCKGFGKRLDGFQWLSNRFRKIIGLLALACNVLWKRLDGLQSLPIASGSHLHYRVIPSYYVMA